MSRLPATWSTQDKMEVVEEVMSVLGLTHIRNSIIGDEETRGVKAHAQSQMELELAAV